MRSNIEIGVVVGAAGLGTDGDELVGEEAVIFNVGVVRTRREQRTQEGEAAVASYVDGEALFPGISALA
jgi:hypothetical protein